MCQNDVNAPCPTRMELGQMDIKSSRSACWVTLLVSHSKVLEAVNWTPS